MKLLLLLLLIFPVFLAAQTPEKNIGINLGVNITKLKNVDSVILEKSSLPCLGVYYLKAFDSKFGIETNGRFSIMGSNVTSPYLRYRYYYLSLNGLPYYQVNDFVKIHFGAEALMLMNATLKKGATTGNVSDLPIKKNSLEEGFNTGISLMLQKDFEFYGRYFIPVNAKFNKIELGINIKLDPENQKSKAEYNNKIAYGQIDSLKNGVLLVRLQSSSNIVETLRNKGDYKEANELDSAWKTSNSEQIKAFRRVFNFCPVYFFYGEKSSEIMAGKISGNLLNDSLQPDFNIIIPHNTSFFIADFDNLTTGTEESSWKSIPGTQALVIKNRFFKELAPPFPYFVSISELGIDKSPFQVVYELNFNLTQFYNKVKQQ